MRADACTDAPGLRVRVVTGAALADLAPAWERCRTASGRPNLQQRHEVLCRWAAGLPGAVVAEVDGEPVGLAPFTRLRESSDWHVRLPSGRRPVLRIGLDTVALVGDALATADDPATLQALYAGVQREARSADVVRFRGIPDEGPLARTIAGQPRPWRQGWLRLTDQEPQFHHRTRLGPDVRTYLGRHLSSRSRRYIERDVRRIEREPAGSRWQVFTEADEMAELLALVDQVEHDSWHARRNATPVNRSGTAERLEAWAALGLVRGYVLSVGHQPIAFLLAYVSDGCVAVAKMGYADTWARRSPGKVLLWHVLDDIHRQPELQALDLGRGHWPFKDVFSGDGYPVRDTTLVRLRPRAVAATLPPLLWRRARSRLARRFAGSTRGEASRQWIRRNFGR